MTEQTVKCPICGEPYKFYAMMVGDQSACPDCIRKAEKKRGVWDIRPSGIIQRGGA